MSETFEQQVLRTMEVVENYHERPMAEWAINFARALAAEWFLEPVAHIKPGGKLFAIGPVFNGDTPLYRKPEGL